MLITSSAHKNLRNPIKEAEPQTVDSSGWISLVSHIAKAAAPTSRERVPMAKLCPGGCGGFFVLVIWKMGVTI